MKPEHMAWVIVGLGFLALWHLVYEMILLPTLRQSARFKVFALRDRLRAFKAEHQQQCSDETFHMLDEQLSWLTDNLPRLTFPLLWKSDKLIQENPELRRQIAARIAIINACKLHEYVEIRRESNDLALHVMSFNAGGWIIYLIPIVYPHLAYEKSKKQIQRLSVLSTDKYETLRMCPA